MKMTCWLTGSRLRQISVPHPSCLPVYGVELLFPCPLEVLLYLQSAFNSQHLYFFILSLSLNITSFFLYSLNNVIGFYYKANDKYNLYVLDLNRGHFKK